MGYWFPLCLQVQATRGRWEVQPWATTWITLKRKPNCTRLRDISQRGERKQANPSSPCSALAHGGSKWQAALPRAAKHPSAAPGSSFSTVDLGVRGAPARTGAPLRGTFAPTGAERGLGTGRGSQGLREAPPHPSRLLHLPPRPRSRPLGGSLPGRAEGRRCQLAASGATRQGSFITLGGCGCRAAPAPAVQATATLAAARAQAAPAATARARSPGLPGWLPPPPLLLGALGPAERARESRRPPGLCARLGGGRRRQSRGAGTSEGAVPARMGSARRLPHPWVSRSPDPAAPGEYRPCPPEWARHNPAPRAGAAGLEMHTERPCPKVSI
ncbi:uncharacterized protein LOC103746895 [Nannospalax galili]|uniref:uncharacterized protein LOC103746895 n=1 Tax=Nannospalax galili TaxID=1026970 RepID=UPI00111C6164|nr:uncharacterized protein LOC103746895 [Nannospalax galili]